MRNVLQTATATVLAGLARARDAERLRTEEITPEALQEENSLFPMDAVITFDFIEYANRAYLSE